jgi:hypothetical protein
LFDTALYVPCNCSKRTRGCLWRPLHFVFSPSAKLNAISQSSDLTRATVITVGDLSESQSLDFLLQTGCSSTRAAEAHKLVDGHLPFLLQEPVGSFCQGTLDVDDLAAYFTALVSKGFMFVDKALDCRHGCACMAACAIRRKEWDYDGLKRAIPLLLNTKLMRSSLAAGSEVIDSRFVQCYVERVCSCNTSVYDLIIPPCGDHF